MLLIARRDLNVIMKERGYQRSKPLIDELIASVNDSDVTSACAAYALCYVLLLVMRQTTTNFKARTH